MMPCRLSAGATTRREGVAIDQIGEEHRRQLLIRQRDHIRSGCSPPIVNSRGAS
jgi:hypothetical protein